MAITTARVSIRAHDGGEFGAFLAVPATGHGPGLVLMQEIFGVNHYMREVAAFYAERGFTVVCPDLFWRLQPGVELTDRTQAEWDRGVDLLRRMDEALAVRDAATAMAYLRRHPACTGKVGGLGFCMGGRLAWLLSTRHDPDAAVGYYGVGIEKTLGEAGGLRSPLMLHVAGLDSHCPPAAQRAIRDALGANPLVTIHEYPDADHAFARTGGAHYDARAAELANARSLEFLGKHLGGAAPPTA